MNYSDDGNVRVSASRLRGAVIVVMLLIAAAILLAWLGTAIGFARVEIQPHEESPLNPLISGTAMMVLAEIALWKLSLMLKAMAEGETFTLRVTGHFRGFAFWLMLMALADLLLPLVSTFAMMGPEVRAGEPSVRLSVDLSSVILLGVTLLLFLLARMLERARAIEEENREIV